jgi:hypothetical protein
MSYLGQIPQSNFVTKQSQTFTPDGSTTSFSLNFSVSSGVDIMLVINNVIQESGAGKAFTATGTTLTMSAAPASVDSMYCIFLGLALQTINPGANSVGVSQISDDAVTTGKIIDGAVTKAKTSSLMYPAFEAYLSADQSISDDTWTKVNIDTEVFDSDSKFASYKFTPGVAGKYFIYASVLIETAGGHEYNLGQTGLYKNGSLFRTNRLDPEGASMIAANVPIQAVVTANDTDYFELFAYMDRTSGGTINIKTSTQSTYFGAYRIGD